MASILKNTQEVTIFRNRETQEFSLWQGIRKIADINQEQFEFVYRFLGKHIKDRVDAILEQPVDDPNVQTVLKALFNHRNF